RLAHDEMGFDAAVLQEFEEAHAHNGAGCAGNAHNKAPGFTLGQGGLPFSFGLTIKTCPARAYRAECVAPAPLKGFARDRCRYAQPPSAPAGAVVGHRIPRSGT